MDSRRRLLIAVYTLLVSSSVCVTAGASQSYDCTSVEIEEDPNIILTVEERIELFDAQLEVSLNKMDECNAALHQQATKAIGEGSGGGGGGQADGSGSGTGQEGNQNSDSQTPMVGDSGDGTTKSHVDVTSQKNLNSNSGTQNVDIKAPNDDGLCKVVYEDIQNESDSKRRTALVQDYNDYGCN